MSNDIIKKRQAELYRQLIRESLDANIQPLEETGEFISEAVGPSDELNHLIGFADVFANLPRQIRLDVMRVVQGDYDNVDKPNIDKALGVLGGLNPELDDVFERYVEYLEGSRMTNTPNESVEPLDEAGDGGSVNEWDGFVADAAEALQHNHVMTSDVADTVFDLSLSQLQWLRRSRRAFDEACSVLGVDDATKMDIWTALDMAIDAYR